MYNHPRPQLLAVMQQSGADYREALVLLDLYGLIEYFKRNGRNPSINELAEDRGTTWRTVRRNVTMMQGLGWLNFVTVDNEGTYWDMKGLPSVTTTQADPSVATAEAPSVAAAEAPSVTTAEDPSVTTAEHQETIQELFQESPQEPNSRSDGRLTNDQKKELVQIFNTHKPASWPKLSVLSEARLNALTRIWEGNGGRTWFVESLPIAMASVSKDDFWTRKIRNPSFDAFFGVGRKAAKNHFFEHFEKGLSSQGSNSISPRSLEHPDFFPPIDAWSDLRPKHGKFANDEDRDRREAEAREFYKQQEA